MRNKLLRFIRRYSMVQPGERVICAVSGGADSMALLWAMVGLREILQITVEAAHFNHNLRGEESNRDAAFVAEFCQKHGIPCHMGSGIVETGEKGLEAAARTARYAFLRSLNGKIATAHTADDNAETLLMHLVRGTGLKGLGGITPMGDRLIRPMLEITRQEVLAFLRTENIGYVDDSSNAGDSFLRNRIRHHVIPLLKEENPRLALSLSETALRLREDEAALDAQACVTDSVPALLQMPAAVQSRALHKLLVQFGVREPEAVHLQTARQLLLSENPSAYSVFPDGVVVSRCYDRLVKLETQPPLPAYRLQCPGQTRIPELGLKITCCAPEEAGEGMCLRVYGPLWLRSRQPGDTLVLPGGTKKLKKLLIEEKIPAAQRERIPVLADDAGVAAVLGIGPGRDRLADPNCKILLETI